MDKKEEDHRRTNGSSSGYRKRLMRRVNEEAHTQEPAPSREQKEVEKWRHSLNEDETNGKSKLSSWRDYLDCTLFAVIDRWGQGVLTFGSA
ncbi:unnamed protein product [Toxocara canis]|uniref:Uncharacterized protein n=1 Tax=Toxocara canis TaxID=6265 RepID=A0A183U1Q9_TOXCA|nr:unnamed protein product [Toxocara canis]